MEVSVLAAQNAPATPVLAIHAGSMRRQAKMEVNRPFVMPHPGSQNCVVEVALFHQLANQLLPDDGKPEATCSIPVRRPDGAASQVQLKVRRGPGSASGVAAPASTKVVAAHVDPAPPDLPAKDYLEHHDLQKRIQRLIQDVLREQPDNPYRYMLQQLRSSRQGPEPPASEEPPEEASAEAAAPEAPPEAPPAKSEARELPVEDPAAQEVGAAGAPQEESQDRSLPAGIKALPPKGPPPEAPPPEAAVAPTEPEPAAVEAAAPEQEPAASPAQTPSPAPADGEAPDRAGSPLVPSPPPQPRPPEKAAPPRGARRPVPAGQSGSKTAQADEAARDAERVSREEAIYLSHVVVHCVLRSPGCMKVAEDSVRDSTRLDASRRLVTSVLGRALESAAARHAAAKAGRAGAKKEKAQGNPRMEAKVSRIMVYRDAAWRLSFPYMRALTKGTMHMAYRGALGILEAKESAPARRHSMPTPIVALTAEKANWATWLSKEV